MSSVAKKLMSAAGAGGDVSPWDLSYAYYDPPAAWDISTAVYSNNSFSVAGQETQPYGISFKPDGTKMYVLGYSGDAVSEYNLSTVWDISTASFLQNFSVSGQDVTPHGLFFKPDGTKMYVLGVSGRDVNEYDLSTAWDVSTASFLQNFSVSGQDTGPLALFFKPDGTKMYVLGAAGDDVNEYNLSTAWDVSSASFLQNFSVSTQEASPTGVFFKPDGLKMYIVGSAGDDVNEYNLSTAWDISTATFLQLFSVAAQDTTPAGLFFKPDGTAFYVIGRANDTVFQYTLGGFSVATQDTSTRGVFFKPDGLKMYVSGGGADNVYQYTLSTEWDVSTASYDSVSFFVGGQDANPYQAFFKPDGTKMYVVGIATERVYQYTLSTVWDISTATYDSVSFLLSGQEANPRIAFFKPDGTKMYVVGNNSIRVHQYTLSTAWDVSTVTYDSVSFDVSGQEVSPFGLSFKPDGKKMFIVGSSTDTVYGYDLNTGWDVSSAVLSDSFSVASQSPFPVSLFFREDGNQMFIAEGTTSSGAIYSYTLGVQE